MSRRDDEASGEVEFLDLGPPDRLTGSDADAGANGGIGAPRRRPRWHWWYALVAAAVVAVVVAATLNKSAQHHSATASQPPTTAPELPSLPSLTSPPSPRPSPNPVTVINAGHSLLDVPRDWELFGRGNDEVVRIELARGRVTRTDVSDLASGGGVSFVAGSDRVIVRPLDNVPGYEVPDGRPSRPLRSSLGHSGPAVPGPRSDQLWVPTGSDTHRSMTLVRFDGRRAGTSIPIPVDVGLVTSDGAGYLLFYGTGGVYDIGRDGTHRITDGDLLAVGPTRWLTYECDERFRCATFAIDRATGARRPLNAAVNERGSTGVISPDGSTAALVSVTEDAAAATVRLLDLSTGVYRATGVSFDPGSGFDGGAVVWSPDSRWLFIAAVTGLRVLDRHTMRFADLGVTLPQISQLALRTGSG